MSSAYLNALSEAPKEDVFAELVRQKERADRLQEQLTQGTELFQKGTADANAHAAHKQYRHVIFNFYRRTKP